MRLTDLVEVKMCKALCVWQPCLIN